MSEDELNSADTEQPQAEEPEVIDIEIEEPPQASGGRGVWFVIVLIIILAAVAWYVFYAMGKAQEAERTAKEVRLQGYSLQQREIGRGLDAAFEVLGEGNVGGAVKTLEQAATRLRNLANRAVANQDDTESGLIALKAKQAEDSLAEAAAMQAELVELLSTQMASLQRSLGLRVTGAMPEEEAPAEEPSEEAVPGIPPQEPVSPELPESPGEEAAPPLPPSL